MQELLVLQKQVDDGTRCLEIVEPSSVARGESGESFADLAHDARNMVTALRLYCDLLEERGVLASAFTHYGSELRLIAQASRSLVEKLTAIDVSRTTAIRPSANGGGREVAESFSSSELIAEERRLAPSCCWEPARGASMASLAAEVRANHNLLAAIAGPAITVTLEVEGGARPVRMTAEDLTRILVNLVRNAAEAMGARGRIHIGLKECRGAAGTADVLTLTMEDDGPGISEQHLDTIFIAGYTTRRHRASREGSWGESRRGHGLAIVRSIVDAAGGHVFAANRPQGGARIEIRLPVGEASDQPSAQSS